MVRRAATALFLAAGILTGCDDNLLDRDEDVTDGLRAEIALLRARVEQLETKLAAVTIEDSGTDFVFTAVNVHVRSGLGATNDITTGLGNLVVGYDEDMSNDKSGAHNIVVGAYHDYTSYGGLVAGYGNTIAAPGASVTGGWGNTASGDCASVSGGFGNEASGYLASVSGGGANTASDDLASVSGGSNNIASGPFSSVSGGGSNIASGSFTSVTGGQMNGVAGAYSSISGGQSNAADWLWSHVCGGSWNSTGADYDVAP